MVVQQVCEVGGGLIVEGFVSNQEDFEVDSLTDGGPVEVLEDGSDVVSGAGEEAGSRVLDMLEFIEEVGWYAVDCVEEAIAVVES